MCLCCAFQNAIRRVHSVDQVLSAPIASNQFEIGMQCANSTRTTKTGKVQACCQDQKYSRAICVHSMSPGCTSATQILTVTARESSQLTTDKNEDDLSIRSLA